MRSNIIMDIKDKSVDELKALAYDLVVNAQRIQNDLMTINQLIANKSQEPVAVQEEAEPEKTE